MTISQYEAACREYCRLCGKDPDEMVDTYLGGKIPRWQDPNCGEREICLSIRGFFKMIEAVIVGMRASANPDSAPRDTPPS